MKNNAIENITEKIIKGLEFSFYKLVKEKQKNNEYLIFSYDGKIVKVKASDIKLTKKQYICKSL